MQLSRALPIAALVCLAGTPALAQINYPNFSDTSGLTLNGAAAAVANGIDPDPVLRLARSGVFFDGGSAFTTAAEVCTAAFSSVVQFRITNPGGLPDSSGVGGADGLTLTLQRAGPTALGVLGGDLGYQGVTPSVAVEFDTWNNGVIDAGTNHVGINVNGSVNSVAKVAVPGRFDDGALWTAWVEYDGAVLEVRVTNTGVRPAAPTLSLAIDIPTTLGANTAFGGFTSATGGAYGDHDIVSWRQNCGSVTIAGCDTGVEDFLLPAGGLFSESVTACAIGAANHGGFVACVAALTNASQKNGFITGRQKGAIQGCAARAPYFTGPVTTAEFLTNGNFETGTTSGWTLATTGSGAWALNTGTLDPLGPALALPPIEGLYDLVSHQNGAQLNRAMQKLVVPLDVHAATLEWSDRVRSNAPLLDPGQEYRVVIRALDLTLLAEVFSTGAGDPAQQPGPNARSVDLTTVLQGLKGQTVLLSFEQQAQSSFFTLTLDDASLMIQSR